MCIRDRGRGARALGEHLQELVCFSHDVQRRPSLGELGGKADVLSTQPVDLATILGRQPLRTSGRSARAGEPGQRPSVAGARGSTRGSKGLSAKNRGEVNRLRAQNVRLTAQLTQTRTALDIMGKAHELLEMLSESTGTSTRPRRS